MSWKKFFRRKQWDEERAQELAAHLQIEADENVSRGMLPEEACYAANRKLGNTTQIREEIFHMNSIGFLEILWQDVRFGARMLRKKSGFTVAAVMRAAGVVLSQPVVNTTASKGLAWMISTMPR